MKRLKILLTIILLTQLNFVKAQGYERKSADDLPNDVYKALYAEVDAVLSNCCQKFNAKFNWGKTTMSYVTEMGINLKVEGLVSYKGKSCGDVTVDYYVVFNSKTGIASDVCIFSPYCFMGVVTSKEWDCNCAEYYTTEQKLQFASKTAPIVIKFINEQKE